MQRIKNVSQGIRGSGAPATLYVLPWPYLMIMWSGCEPSPAEPLHVPCAERRRHSLQVGKVPLLLWNIHSVFSYMGPMCKHTGMNTDMDGFGHSKRIQNNRVHWTYVKMVNIYLMALLTLLTSMFIIVGPSNISIKMRTYLLQEKARVMFVAGQ